MKMKESPQTLLADQEAMPVAADEEATLIAPRFDAEETVLARPVVPLEEANANAPSASVVSRPYYSRLPLTPPRRSWMLMLVLVSVLAGGLLGGTALYLYQNHSREDGTSAGAASQPKTSVSTSQAATLQPTPAPTTEAVSALPPSHARPEDNAANASVDEETGASNSDDKASNSGGKASNSDGKETGTGHTRNAERDAENVPAAEDRSEHDEDDRVGTPKRGKKGEHDEQPERPRRPANSGGEGRQLSRADAAPDQRDARRVDTIIYRPRRATRRAGSRPETAGDADRLRRIFEGQP
jgi:hypothetical protein